ncbi:hypothetical protein MCERE19_02428 [Spirosomataceae bacterium]
MKLRPIGLEKRSRMSLGRGSRHVFSTTLELTVGTLELTGGTLELTGGTLELTRKLIRKVGHKKM